MKIKINEKYVLTSDALNIIINEARVRGKDAKTPGETYLYPIAFFGRLEHVISYLIDLSVFHSGATDLNTLKEEIEIIRKEARDAVEKYDWIEMQKEIDSLKVEIKRLKAKK